MGGDLGVSNVDVGDGPCIRLLVFREVVLLYAWQSANKGVMKECFVLISVRKGSYCVRQYQIYNSDRQKETKYDR